MEDKTPRVAEFTNLLELVTKKWGLLITEGKAVPAELDKHLTALSKLGKLTPVRLKTIITGRWMEANPDWSKKAKKGLPPEEHFAVFQDAQRHTCIRIAMSNKGSTFIPMATELLVYELSNYEFEKLYTTQLTDYPVKKAAQLYLEAKWLNCSPLAKKHLDFICGNTFIDPVKGTLNQSKEPTMATAAQTKPAGKAPAKPEVVKAAVKAATKPAAKAAPAAKVAPTKAAAKPAAKADKGGKVSKYAGKKITLVQKENPKREGTAAFGVYKLYKDGMTTEKFLEAGGSVVALDYDSKKGFIKLV